MAWEARLGLKQNEFGRVVALPPWLNGLGSPFGFEIAIRHPYGSRGHPG